MIRRFPHDMAVPFTNNAGEREIRGAKIRQRIGGCWRTRAGLADFAATWSYLATAAKHGIDHLEALTRLFTTGPGSRPPPRTRDHLIIGFKKYVNSYHLICRHAPSVMQIKRAIRT
jgi:hypothetical protein